MSVLLSALPDDLNPALAFFALFPDDITAFKSSPVLAKLTCSGSVSVSSGFWMVESAA